MNNLDIPTDPHARTSWVQHQLRLRRSSFSAIARERGWSRRAVAMAMHVPSYPQEQAIADAIGVAIERLFPERYDRDGQRLHAVRKPKDSRAAPGGNVKGQEAA